MNKCKRCRRLLKDAVVGELTGDADRFFTAHLKQCAECRAAYDELEATVQILNKPSREQPDPEFWDGYWDRLQARMTRENVFVEKARTNRSAGRRFLFGSPRWAWQTAAAAALVVVGIFLGRALFAPDVPSAAPGPNSASVVKVEPGFELVRRAQEYVGRSQRMLLAIVNFDPESEDPYALDLDTRRRVSRDLVTEAAWLKQELEETRSHRLRELVSDLEVILLQIANLENPDLVDIDMIRTGVESRGILFKIYLINSDPKLQSRADESSGDAASKIL